MFQTFPRFLNVLPIDVLCECVNNHFQFYVVSIIPVAKWKKLSAKTVKTRERFRGLETSTSESSTIPGLELYDNIDGKFVSNSHSTTANKQTFFLLFTDWLDKLVFNYSNYINSSILIFFFFFHFIGHCTRVFCLLLLPYLGHEVNLASILILENFAVPANQDDAPTPLSRYSSSESVLRLDGNSTSSGSVAEKAMMFELTANMQSNRLSPKPHSIDGQLSPARRHSPSPRPNHKSNDSPIQKERNGNVKHSTVNGSDDKQTNFQDMLTEQMIANRNWGDIMDTES